MAIRNWNVWQLVLLWVVLVAVGVMMFPFLAAVVLAETGAPDIAVILAMFGLPIVALLSGLVVTWQWFGSRKPTA